ncbi:uncharacterized protein YigE (DUF2233 family) [Deinobacterium chartae]|uniref:Uncharacterized protein YigE (DUF2233 family) n=1 Tax=Deinobacterium chartae TaxID=521158 RepID=A0A841HW19_9DEIO|nr:phosphodiester glycosidase family protein [Deinobacterium chartae]MBB6097587.1 uncharacterized protein YigE (DUF2233 family) [Deinobacterium chartae]
MRLQLIPLSLLLALFSPAFASARSPVCQTVSYRTPETGRTDRYTFCHVRAQDGLRLHLADSRGRPYGSFAALKQHLEARGQRLLLAMNGGMFHRDFRPVGLHVENGHEQAPLNLQTGWGNFFLKPNGVFYATATRFGITESGEFRRKRPPLQALRFATQSGPLLLRSGQLHPALRANSDSRLIRNGVCASGSTATLVLAETRVNLFEFATFFRHHLRCADALYLDGSLSALYAPGRERNSREPLGPILALSGSRPR